MLSRLFVTLGPALTLALAGHVSAAAITVVECVDAAGAASFRDRCPPGTVQTGELQIHNATVAADGSLEEVASENPVLLYVVPECDACDLVRNLLQKRSIPYDEVDVQDNAERQENLKALSGGLVVPAVTIGATVLTGYSKTGLDNALTQAGYPARAVE